MAYAYLSLGSNLGDRRRNLQIAASAIERLEKVDIVAVSSLYETSPVGGPQDQPDYLNAVVLIETSLPPRELLRELQAIENTAGRVRGERWGPRTLDLDILTWGDISLTGEELVIPHPRLYERLFVLAPLLEIGVIQSTGIDEELAAARAAEIEKRGEQSVVVVADADWWKSASPV